MFDYGYAAFLFILLYLGHYVADFIFQDTTESMRKITHSSIRFKHSLKYGTITLLPVLCFVAFTFPGSPCLAVVMLISWLALLITHYFIDDRRLVMWIVRNIKKDKGAVDSLQTPVFVIIEIDQILHKLVLFIVTIFIALFITK
jgi:hypothetical protein